MNISLKRMTLRALPCAGIALLVTSCGGGSSDDHYSSAGDFRAAMEDEGFPCSEVDTTNEFTGHGESLRCEEGHVLTVWAEDLPDYAEADGATPTSFEHLRGDTWNVASDNAEQLDAIQDVFGGERTARDLADNL